MTQSTWVVIDETVLKAAIMPEHPQHEAARLLLTKAVDKINVVVPASAWISVLSEPAAQAWMVDPKILTRTLDVGVLQTMATIHDQAELSASAGMALATALRLKAKQLVSTEPARYGAGQQRYPEVAVLMPSDFLGPQQASWI